MLYTAAYDGGSKAKGAPGLGLGCTDAYTIRVRVYTGVHTCPR